MQTTSHNESVFNESLWVKYEYESYESRDVRPHNHNQNIPSPPSMNLDPVPPVRPLLTHVIADEPLRREAGISTNTVSLRNTTLQCMYHNTSPFWNKA